MWYLAKTSSAKEDEIARLKQELRQHGSERALDNPGYDDAAVGNTEGEGVYAEPVEGFDKGMYAEDSAAGDDGMWCGDEEGTDGEQPGSATDVAGKNAGSGYIDVEGDHDDGETEDLQGEQAGFGFNVGNAVTSNDA